MYIYGQKGHRLFECKFRLHINRALVGWKWFIISSFIVSVDDSLRESLQYFYHIPDKNFIDSSSVEGMRKMAEWTKSLIVDEDVYWQLCNVYDGDAMYMGEWHGWRQSIG